MEYDLALPELIPLSPNVTISRTRQQHISSENSTPPRPTRCPMQYHSVPDHAWAASVLSSPNPSRLSTPSPARDVLPVYVSVYPRGVQPSRTDAARSSTCSTTHSSIWGTWGPCSTMPTDGPWTGQRCPRQYRCLSCSRMEQISRQGRRRCRWCRVASS